MPGNIILDWIIAISYSGVTIIANVMIQSSIIICIGLITAFLLRSQGAVVQSLVYRAVLGAVILCVPAAMLIEKSGFDGLKVIVPLEAARESASIQTGETGPALKKHVAKTDPSFISSNGGSELSAEQSAVSITKTGRNGIADFNPFGHSPISRYIRTWLYVSVTMIWITLSVFAVLRLIGYIISVRWLRKTAIDADKSVIDSVWRISNELNVDPPDVMLSPFAKSPFLTGLFSPTILLPEGISITDAILYHELAHHRRHDCFWNMVSEIACALMPLQPLMAVLSNAIEETSDYVSDNYALAFGDEAHSYAVQLASIAAQFQPVPAEAAVGVGFISSKSCLIKRIEHILDESGRFLISVKANVVSTVILFAFGISVLTGFVGFTKETLNKKINIIDIRIVETPEKEIPVDSALPVSVTDIPVMASLETHQEQSRGKISQQHSISAMENMSAKAHTDNPENIESVPDDADNSDWEAFGESYDQKYIDPVYENTENDAAQDQTLSAVSRTLVDVTPVRLVDENKKRNVTKVIVGKDKPSESEYDRIVRDPETPRFGKAAHPLAELYLSQGSIKKETRNTNEWFSWEVMLSDKQRR